MISSSPLPDYLIAAALVVGLLIALLHALAKFLPVLAATFRNGRNGRGARDDEHALGNPPPPRVEPITLDAVNVHIHYLRRDIGAVDGKVDAFRAELRGQIHELHQKLDDALNPHD